MSEDSPIKIEIEDVENISEDKLPLVIIFTYRLIKKIKILFYIDLQISRGEKNCSYLDNGLT